MLGSYVVFIPPGVPRERVEFLREAFSQILKQPEARQALDKLFGKDILYPTPGELEKMIETLTNQKKDLKQTFNTLVDKYVAMVR